MRRLRIFSGLILWGFGAAAFAAPPLVAIIDSGIARTRELTPLLKAEYDMAAEPARSAFQPRYDHGTMVATILARSTSQPMEIISFRIDDPAGCPAGATPPCQPSGEPVAAAIREAVRLGVNVINLSLSMGDNPRIVRAIQDAAAAGTHVVMAAGNEGRSRPGNIKAAMAGYPHTVLVGAIDDDGAIWAGTNRPDPTPAGYSYAWHVGVAVPTVSASGASVYATGTSFATPIETARYLDTLAAEKPRDKPSATRTAAAQIAPRS